MEPLLFSLMLLPGLIAAAVVSLRAKRINAAARARREARRALAAQAG